jgi:hypothetical protein
MLLQCARSARVLTVVAVADQQSHTGVIYVICLRIVLVHIVGGSDTPGVSLMYYTFTNSKYVSVVCV